MILKFGKQKSLESSQESWNQEDSTKIPNHVKENHTPCNFLTELAQWQVKATSNHHTFLI